MNYMNATTPPKARDCWCPFARAWDSNDDGTAAAAVNRDSYGRFTGQPNCIAHQCMAWRWAQVVQLRNRATPETGRVEPPRPADIPETWVWSPPDEAECLPGMWIEPESEAAERALGYCALAGDPAQRAALEDLTRTVQMLDNTTQRLVAATGRR